MILMFIILIVISLLAAYIVSQPDKPARASSFPRIRIDKPMARRILEISEHATDVEIKDAYRRLIAKLHPDQGGSAFLMDLVIEAKNLLEQHPDAKT